MKIEELKQVGVLQAMGEETLTRAASVLQEIDCVDGQLVVAEGDPGDSMYFIVQGCVRIEKLVQGASVPSKILAVLEAGDYFGEMALLDQKPRSASAIATGPARLLRLSRTGFEQLQAQGKVGMNVLFAMLHTSNERIRRLSAQVIVYDAVGKAIGESRTLQQLLDAVLKHLSAAVLADWGLLVLRSSFSSNLEVLSALNLKLDRGQEQAIADAKGFLRLALEDGRERVWSDFNRELPEGISRLGFETASLMWAPICVEQDLLGLIVLGTQTPAQFDLNALNLVKGVARQTAQAILNARHREEEQARARHARQFVRF
jgi:CRP-like cAMP-binding protein